MNYISCGALQIVLNLYELTQNRQLLDNAVEFANKLIENAKYEDKGTIYWVSTQATNALAGLSHGQSGFSLMFARMGKITKNQYYINISRKAMNYEDQFYNTKIGNWSDQRIINGVKNEEKGVNPVAWCHGATGILLSRIYMYDCIENNEFRKLVCEDIDNAVQSSIKYGYRNNYCLCHGDFGNIEILREYAIKFQDKKIEDLCNNLIVSILYRKEKKSDLLECVITTISLVTSLIIYIVGGYFVERQELSLGELVQFVSLATFFIVPFKSISVYMPQFSTIREMIERIKEVLFYKEISNDGKINLNRFEKLEMKGVYFGYAANETLLKDININVYAGNKIAIVGPSGSGKTSITKLMMNIFDTYEGHILINGVEIDKINRESYYKKLAVVTQQPLAFNDTIRKNIDPSETLDDNQIYEVLKQAELYDEIMQFPLKLNTKIGENGQNISGGQKQRIAIARALASNPSIVIFDEGTSNLDSVTEKSIFENLNEKGITQIIISHRLSTTQDADYIYVIKDGKIVESGKHDELIKKMGVYYQNYTSYQ